MSRHRRLLTGRGRAAQPAARIGSRAGGDAGSGSPGASLPISGLVTGGTHGDEYEGQWTAAALCRVLAAEDVHGRLIVVPTLNRPAALAGRRTSPIDGADINRVFPPRENAKGPSAAIARFLWQKCILPASALLDIHSGGSEMEFVLSSNLQGRLGSTASEADVAALLAMDAPYAIVFDEGDARLGSGYEELAMRYPRPGWAEQDATEIWRATERVMRDSPLVRGSAGTDTSVTASRIRADRIRVSRV